MAGLTAWLKEKRSSRERPVTSIVVVAAGSAARMEGVDKILVPLGELPAIVHTLWVFQDCPLVDEVIVVTSQNRADEISRLCRQYRLNKVSKVVLGGKERLDSVRRGVDEVRPDAGLIGIHDGARPLLPQNVLEEVLRRGAETGAAAPALPLTDTVKRVKDGLAIETVDRASLMGVQTPQVFDGDLIRAALQKAAEDGAAVTDDCSCVERMGMKVAMTAGSKENLKLTTPFDLLTARAILEARGKGEL